MYDHEVGRFCGWFGDGAAAAFAANVDGLCHQCGVCEFVLKLYAFSVILCKSAKCEEAWHSTVNRRS